MKRLLVSLGPHIEHLATIVLLLLLSLAAVGFLIYQVRAISHPYPLDYGEAPPVVTWAYNGATPGLTFLAGATRIAYLSTP